MTFPPLGVLVIMVTIATDVLIGTALDSNLQKSSNTGWVPHVAVSLYELTNIIVAGTGLLFLVCAVHTLVKVSSCILAKPLISQLNVVVFATFLAGGAGPCCHLVHVAAGTSSFVGLRFGKSAKSCTLLLADLASFAVTFGFLAAVGSGTANKFGVLEFITPVGGGPAKRFAIFGGFFYFTLDATKRDILANVLESIVGLFGNAGEVAFPPEVGNGEIAFLGVSQFHVIDSASISIDSMLFGVHGP